MEKFIKEQIDSYGGLTYDINKILKNNSATDGLFIITIKSNKIYADMSNDFMTRKKRVVLILSEMLEKYQTNDTILFVNIKDGYYWGDDFPAFSFSVPKGKKGLIYPNFDVCFFDLLQTNFDGVKKIIQDYEPTKITNDVYFKGGPTSTKKTKIREKVSANTSKDNIFDIKVLKDYTEPIFKIKDHKYLLDLPGVKPWSVRFKYLLLSERIVIRISLYNPKYDETGYWRQSYDYIFEENVDYIHLIYKVDYDKPVSDSIHKQIKNDLATIYEYYEKHEPDYNKTINNLKNKAKKFTYDEMLLYLHTLIQEYTKKLIV